MYIRSVYTFFVYRYAEKSFIGVFGSISRNGFPGTVPDTLPDGKCWDVVLDTM